jgi:hypothetical protein
MKLLVVLTFVCLVGLASAVRNPQVTTQFQRRQEQPQQQATQQQEPQIVMRQPQQQASAQVPVRLVSSVADLPQLSKLPALAQNVPEYRSNLDNINSTTVATPTLSAMSSHAGNFSTEVSHVPEGLSRLATAEYKIDILRNRLFELQAQINKRERERKVAEKLVDGAFENMQNKFNEYVHLFQQFNTAEPQAKDPGPALVVGKEVAKAQDRHFSLTSAWMERSAVVAADLLSLQENKHELERAIGKLQASIAEITLSENDSFKMP